MLLKDLFCKLCALQFHTKSVFDMHHSLVHKKDKEGKDEPLDCNEDSTSEKVTKMEDMINRVTRVPGFQEQTLPWKDLGILS